jgi:cytochrome c-type biogenesis protein CcmH/NrfG
VEALRLEPDSPVLLAAMGYNYYNFVNTGIGQDDMLAQAIQYCEEALKRDPESVDAHRLKGAIGLSLQGDVRIALEALRFVMRRTPEDTETAFWLALACGFVGQMEEARVLADRVMKLDPLNANSHITHAWTYFMNGMFDEAVALTRLGYEREPNMFATFTHAQALIHAGKWDELETVVGPMRAEMDSAPLFRLLLAQYHAHKGEREAMEALIVDDLMKTVNRDFQYPWQLSLAWLFLGEKEKALELLEGAVTRGFWNYRFLGEYDPYVAVLRDHPRFVALMAKAKALAESVAPAGR